VNDNYESQPLTAISRGETVESLHRGHIAVMDGDGLTAHLGDPRVVTYMRSCAKPFQAMAFIEGGISEKFNLNDREIAAMCASHYAEDFHLEAVLSILEKAGVTVKDLLCGDVYSMKDEVASMQVRAGLKPGPLFNDCSGKHAGYLAFCVHRGLTVRNYTSIYHPVHRPVIELIGRFCEIDPKFIQTGVDGCSLPTFALPLESIARAFMRLADHERLPSSDRDSAARIYRAMTSHPEMVAGSGGFCTEIMKATSGRMVAKVGAEGVYAIGVRDAGIGLAVKVEDGAFRALWPSVVELLLQLDLIGKEELRRLNNFHTMAVLNDRGSVVGEVRPRFKVIRR